MVTILSTNACLKGQMLWKYIEAKTYIFWAKLSLTQKFCLRLWLHLCHQEPKSCFPRFWILQLVTSLFQLPKIWIIPLFELLWSGHWSALKLHTPIPQYPLFPLYKIRRLLCTIIYDHYHLFMHLKRWIFRGVSMPSCSVQVMFFNSCWERLYLCTQEWFP